jgi:hypothetical protein
MRHIHANFKFAEYVGDKQTRWNPGPHAREHVYIIYPSIFLLWCYVISPTKTEWHFKIFLSRASVTYKKFIKKTNMHYVFVLLHIPHCIWQFE